MVIIPICGYVFQIREIVRNDPRYIAVKREEREGLFLAYISELHSAEQEAERAAKAKREEEVQHFSLAKG